jgi:signal transduction histidine kinase
LAALGRLAASIAHEVNNPLGIIKNYLTIISKLADKNSELKINVSIVHEEVDRIAKIVRQLLDFYRPTLEKQVELNIVELLTSTIDLIAPKFDDMGIAIHTEFEEKDLKIYGSPNKLKQVFLNLLLNARDVMPERGKLIVSVRKNRNIVEIEFADTGSGISQEDLPRIFEPFFTSKKDSGTGLGLAVCHGIIGSHNGTISAANNSDGGATFIIRLPLK